MFAKPVSFLFDFGDLPRKFRQFIMHEFAVNGAKHLVLTDQLISMIFQSPDLRKTLAEDIRAEGMTFVDAHSPFGPMLDLNCPFPECRNMLVEYHKLAIITAAEMGVDTITVHLGNNKRPGFVETPIPKLIDLMKDSLEKILPTAEQFGVAVSIENIWSPTNTPDVLLSIKKEFPTDALGFCYDAGHAHLMESSSARFEECAAKTAWKNAPDGKTVWENRALEKMLPHIVNCHLHDNDGATDQHRNIGHGSIDWNHIIPLLKKAPKLKNIQSEVIPAREKEAIFEIVGAFRKLGEIV